MSGHRLKVPLGVRREIAASAAGAFGLRAIVLLGSGRTRRESAARSAAAWAMRRRWPGLAWGAIAEAIGCREHSSANHAARQADRRRQVDAEFRALTDALAAGMPVPGMVAVRRVKPKNDFSADDGDGVLRQAGTDALLAALRREHPERCAA